MSEMENEVEFYYEKLKDSKEPSKVLLEFFNSITGIQITRTEIIMINKLIKLFGRFTLFFAIVDLSKIENLSGNLYGLLHTICKNRFEKSHDGGTVAAFEPLGKRINELEKLREKILAKKIKVPPPDEL